MSDQPVVEIEALSDTHYARLYECVRSGQMTEAEVAAEMRDPAFAEYYAERTAR